MTSEMQGKKDLPDEADAVKKSKKEIR